jgi:hypothetical protein
VLAKYGSVDDGRAHFERAREGFERAMALSPDLPLLHHLYTHFEVEMGQSRNAMRRLLTQARARPSDPDLYAGLVVATRYCGLMEASLAADATARRLDPGVRTSVLYTHLLRCDWERAAEFGKDPFVKFYVLPMLGRADEAMAIYRSQVTPTPFVVERVPLSIAALEAPAACRDALGSDQGHARVHRSRGSTSRPGLARAGDTESAPARSIGW